MGRAATSFHVEPEEKGDRSATRSLFFFFFYFFFYFFFFDHSVIVLEARICAKVSSKEAASASHPYKQGEEQMRQTSSTAATTTTATDAMDLAIRVNVRYAAPANSQIKDALRMFKSARWVQSIIRYILPQLNSVSPASVRAMDALKQRLVAAERGASCVVCMEVLDAPCAQLPCRHQFHVQCIEPWLKMHSTCPTCRDQLPTDAFSNYSVYAINTTIILQQSQAQMPPAELLELSASNQIIRAVVNARVRRNTPASAVAARSNSSIPSMSVGNVAPSAFSLPSSSAGSASSTAAAIPIDMPLLQMNPPVMNASLLQRGANITAALPPCISEPVVPMLHRNASRRRLRREISSDNTSDEDAIHQLGKRRRLETVAEEAARGAAAEREATTTNSLRVLRRR